MKKTTLLMITSLFIFSTVSFAADRSSISGFHTAMHYLAGKESRANDQKAAEHNEVHIAVNTSAADDNEKGTLNNSKEKVSSDKK